LISEKRTVWPDPHLGCLGAKDQRLGLPGNIGLESALRPREEGKPSTEILEADKAELEGQARFWKSLLGSPTNHQRQAEVGLQYFILWNT